MKALSQDVQRAFFSANVVDNGSIPLPGAASQSQTQR